MRKILLLILLASTAWACGGGGSGSTVSSDPSDFSGTYSLRDDNCSGTPIQRFRITQIDTFLTLTVLDPGDSTTQEGDQFSGDVENVGGTYFTSSSDLGCSAYLVSDQDEADFLTDLTAVNHEAGDLTAICTDETSADLSCDLSYRRT